MKVISDLMFEKDHRTTFREVILKVQSSTTALLESKLSEIVMTAFYPERNVTCSGRLDMTFVGHTYEKLNFLSMIELI